MNHPSPSEPPDTATVTRLRGALDELVHDLPSESSTRDLAVDLTAVRRPLRRARRRRLVPIAAVLVACTLIALGLVAVIGDIGRDTSNDNGIRAGEEPPAPPDDSAVPSYELRLDDAQLVNEETLTAGNTDVSLWVDDEQQTYLSLSVRPGLARAYEGGMGPMTEDTSFPATEGRAWFGEVAGIDPRSMKMWWARADGDLWLVTAHWYGSPQVDLAVRRAALRDWALAIEYRSGAASAPYVFTQPTMRLVAFDRAGELRSRARVWRYRGEEITLLVIEDSVAAGRANLLDIGKPEPVTVAGRDGWSVARTSAAGTIIGWEPDGTHPAWATLTIPAALADRTDEILHALVPA